MPLSIKPHTSYLDKSFKESHTRSYVMAMQFSLHGLAFIIFNPEKNRILGLQAYAFGKTKDLSEIPVFFDLILSKQGWFAYPFRDFYFLMQNSFSTLIPAPLFDKNNKNLYLGFNQPFQEGHRIVFDTLTNTETYNIYYLPNSVAEKIRNLWPNAKVIHYSTALIESLLVGFKNKLDPQHFFVDVHEDNIDLVYFKENKLFYYNNFSYHSKEDFIYFLLSALEQLQLNPETAHLVMMGKIDKNDPKYEMIYRYIRHHEFIPRNDSFQYSYLLDNVMHHQYFTLYNVLQCEL